MARGFAFRLQPVLEQREREEERAQLALAFIERERLGIEEQLRQIQAELLDTRRVMRDGLGPGSAAPGTGEGGGGLTSVRRAAHASLHLTVRAQRAAMELAGVHKRLEAARAELLRTSAARKAVQLLKDRALEAFKRERLKREMAELDELTVMRHGRDEARAAAAMTHGSDRA